VLSTDSDRPSGADRQPVCGIRTGLPLRSARFARMQVRLLMAEPRHEGVALTPSSPSSGTLFIREVTLPILSRERIYEGFGRFDWPNTGETWAIPKPEHEERD
jgi:hypothetical protein